MEPGLRARRSAEYRRGPSGPVIHSVGERWTDRNGCSQGSAVVRRDAVARRFPHLWRCVWRLTFLLQIAAFFVLSGSCPAPREGCYARPLLGPRQEHLERVEQTRGTSADQLWNDVSHRLREHLSDTTYATWFASARPGELRDDDFEVVLPNDFTRGWIEGHFLEPPPRRGARQPRPRRPRRAGGRRGRRARRRSASAARRRRAGVRSRRTRNRARTRSTPSTTSSSARRTASRTRRPWPSPSRRRRPTTRSSSTAATGSARRTSCRRSARTSATTRRASRRAT